MFLQREYLCLLIKFSVAPGLGLHPPTTTEWTATESHDHLSHLQREMKLKTPTQWVRQSLCDMQLYIAVIRTKLLSPKLISGSLI